MRDLFSRGEQLTLAGIARLIHLEAAMQASADRLSKVLLAEAR